MSLDSITTSAAGGAMLWHLGGLLCVRARAGDTGGAVAVIDEHTRRGYQTPRHVHSKEDETLLVISGEVAFERGDQAGRAGPGEVVFLPRGVPHSFRVASPYASFVLIITPGGFEEFFGLVSRTAPAERIPDPGEDTPADLQTMATTAARFGVTLLASPATTRPELAATAAAGLAQARTRADRDAAYDQLAHLLTTAATLPAGLRKVVRTLTTMLTDPRPDPRAAILLGIIAERLPDAPASLRAEVSPMLTAATPTYLRCARRATDRSTILACYYLLAHFAELGEAILAALTPPPAGVDPDAHARLVRCLHVPDFTAEETIAQIGRVWPSPTAWDLSAAEAAIDAEWRAEALTPEAGPDLWAAETTALLAALGADADAALEDR